MHTALVVDDSPMIRHMVRMSLEDIGGLTITEAGTGLEAIELLMIRGADLVVLDLNMPDMHGLEVLRFVRRHAAFSSLPIIVLTTRGDENTRESAMAAGASLFRTKPFRPDALASDARALLDQPALAPARSGAGA
ncbi:MAG TPA: response regulator [Vicinamibacterales bacterium]|nr:response regulator [Vicinamibacterales bacterium]